MRLLSILVVSLSILVTTRTLLAQSSSSSSTRPSPPKEILGKDVKAWSDDINSPDPAVRVKASQILANFGEGARKEGAPALIKRLKIETDPSVRVNLIMAIENIGLEEKDVGALLETIRGRIRSEQQAFVRYHWTTLAAQMGPTARSLIPELVERAKDTSSYEVRKAAIFALGAVGAGLDRELADRTAIQALAAAFAGGGLTAPDVSAENRLEAVIALAGIGNVSPTDRAFILNAFQRATKDKEKTVAIWAYVGLMAHDKPDDKYLDAITSFLKPGEPYHLRVQACRALGVMQNKSKSKVDDLIDCLNDKEPLFVAVAAWSLGEIGEYAEKAVANLQELEKKKETNEDVKSAARNALEKITGKKQTP